MKLIFLPKREIDEHQFLIFTYKHPCPGLRLCSWAKQVWQTPSSVRLGSPEEYWALYTNLCPQVALRGILQYVGILKTGL